jgi:hypothetical protein
MISLLPSKVSRATIEQDQHLSQRHNLGESQLLLGHYPFISRLLIARKWNLSRESNWNRCPGSVNNSVSFYFHNANDIVLKPPFNALKQRIGAHFLRPFSEISILNRVATLMPTFSRAWVLAKEGCWGKLVGVTRLKSTIWFGTSLLLWIKWAFEVPVVRGETGGTPKTGRLHI